MRLRGMRGISKHKTEENIIRKTIRYIFTVKKHYESAIYALFAHPMSGTTVFSGAELKNHLFICLLFDVLLVFDE